MEALDRVEEEMDRMLESIQSAQNAAQASTVKEYDSSDTHYEDTLDENQADNVLADKLSGLVIDKNKTVALEEEEDPSQPSAFHRSLPHRPKKMSSGYSKASSGSISGTHDIRNTGNSRSELPGNQKRSAARGTGDFGSSNLSPSKLKSIEEETQAMDIGHVEPVVVQVGRPTQEEITRKDTRKPQPYVRPFGKVEDPIAKTKADEAIAEWEKANASGTLKPTEPLQLHEPKPPKYDPGLAKSKKTRFHGDHVSLASMAATHIPDSIDKTPIYLTSRDQLARYPMLGTLSYYKYFKERPMFRFHKDGIIVHDRVSMKIIKMFLNEKTRPDWHAVVPNYRVVRAQDPNVDLEVDEWIMYWETLVVHADIRRGCQLAVAAAAAILKEKGA